MPLAGFFRFQNPQTFQNNFWKVKKSRLNFLRIKYRVRYTISFSQFFWQKHPKNLRIQHF